MEPGIALAASRFDEAQHLAIELDDDRLLNRIVVSHALLNVQEGASVTTLQDQDDFIKQAINQGGH